MTALLELGAAVGWPDAEAISAARAHPHPQRGRLADQIEWLAGTQGQYPPTPPRRPRLVVVGTVTGRAADLAAVADIGVRAIEATGDAFTQGAAAADDEIEAGADLIALAAADDTSSPAVLISVLTATEPVALLPRGVDAIDTVGWIRQAEELRDARRTIAGLRSRPDELLEALGSPTVAAAAGFALRAAARRTPVVLDGVAVLAAGLLCVDIQTRARHWWQVADTAPSRAHKRAVEELEMTPVLDLGTEFGDGTAGVLAIQVLRTAALTGAHDD